MLISSQEAILIISICRDLPEIGWLRSLIVRGDKPEDFPLNLETLNTIESLLPAFGSVDENVYQPFRVKLNAEIFSLETKKAVRYAGKDHSKGQAENPPRLNAKGKPRYNLPRTKRKNSKTD